MNMTEADEHGSKHDEASLHQTDRKGTGEAEALELGFIPDMTSLVKIQDEATVSRTIMQHTGGNVVLFSFDEGQQLSEHTAAMPVFVQTVSGHLKVTASGRTVDLLPGGLVYFPTRLPHAVEAVEPSIMMLTMITSARAAATV
jgi:quercetin dioxygenase-like cupin family protein